MELPDRKKRLGIKRFLASFKYSFAGLKYAYLNEQSMLIHLLAVIVVVFAGIALKINTTEWLFCLCMFGFVMGAELLNTAIEATIDLVTKEYHPMAKVAKDTASAAVLVLSVVAAIVGLAIFIPKIIALF